VCNLLPVRSPPAAENAATGHPPRPPWGPPVLVLECFLLYSSPPHSRCPVPRRQAEGHFWLLRLAWSSRDNQVSFFLSLSLLCACAWRLRLRVCGSVRGAALRCLNWDRHIRTSSRAWGTLRVFPFLPPFPFFCLTPGQHRLLGGQRLSPRLVYIVFPCPSPLLYPFTIGYRTSSVMIQAKARRGPLVEAGLLSGFAPPSPSL